MYKTHPQYREILRMIMAAVGRGGEGDVGQRIRDEILVIQVKLMVLGEYIVIFVHCFAELSSCGSAHPKHRHC